MEFETTHPGGVFRQPIRKPKGYDTALICTAGHMVNASSKLRPQHNAAHCDSCGRPTIDACPACEKPIRGKYHVPNVISATTASVPKHCHACGEAYPWTAERLQAAKDLMAEFDKLTKEDRRHFAEALPDLLSDTPSSTVAAMRVKRLLTKAGKEAPAALLEILKGVITSGATKAIWG